ncbi:MAG: FtsX-like permease family protein [Litorilinea sp.]
MNWLSPTSIMLGLLAGIGLILLYIGYINLRNPVLVKVGLRNIPRRPAQSILIVVGLTLSTIIIVSAFSIGDTLNHSVRSHTIKAYGNIDEILAPPLLSLFTSLADPESLDEAETDSNAQAEELDRLMEGGLTTVLAFLDGGLPGVSTARYNQLRAEAEEEPLIDAVTGSIIFPTIIRNVTTGQGEPLGFIFAVDTNYPDEFGLTSIDGTPVRMENLQTGVGNIFAQASNLFALVEQSAAQLGLEGFRISDAALATAAIGTALTAGMSEEGVDLADISIDVESLAALGLDTGFLEEEGIESLSLDSLGLDAEQLRALGVSTTTVNLGSVGESVGLDLEAAETLGTNLLGALNLNTLGAEMDRVLAQFGLQLRQGDIYLSRMGAERMNAQPGDIVEIFIGPLPVPFRVRAIVDEVGPVGALAPVVMMRLDEAQQLLFMRDKVNAILVSNQGDELTGMQHTEAVSERLRVLALDPVAFAAAQSILTQPDVLPIVRTEADQFAETIAEEFDGPPFILDILENFGAFGAEIEQVQRLPVALESDDSDQLRELLADLAVREWLLQLDLPATEHNTLRTALADLNQFDVLDPLSKSIVVLAADIAGVTFSSLFSMFGALSILAGILLIFLIFIMMAAERRAELGMARAIGLQRSHLVQMFVTEGVVYDLLAAALGVALGLGISYAMVGFIGQLFNSISNQVTGQSALFAIQFRAAPTSLVIAYCIGVLFTFIVVTIAAWRASRLNIVAAIRDLPEPVSAQRRGVVHRVWRAARGPLLLGLGIVLAVFYADRDLTLLRVAATLGTFGLGFTLAWAMDLRNMREETLQRVAYTVMGAGLLLIWAVPLHQLDIFNSSPLSIGPWRMLGFILSVPLIILGAILVIMFNADAWTWGLTRLLGGVGALTPVLRTAVAYPLSTRFRTGTTMVLFAMIISTVTVMALVIEATQTAVRPDIERTLGFEISASGSLLSFFDPMRDLESAMASRENFPIDDVASVAAISEADAEMRLTEARYIEGDWPMRSLIGLNEGYIDAASQTYTFGLRAAGFADDAAIWEALRTRTDVAIVHPEWLRRVADYVPEDAQELPDLELIIQGDATPGNNTEGTEHRVQIIGVLEQQSNLAGEGVQINMTALESIVTDLPAPTFYIKVAPDASVHTVAAAIEREFVGNALYATVLAENFAQGQAITRGILQLLQGFLALGLLVGIAALGVISTRTVVERRQQVGMLRAIGYQPRMIALSFVLESSFIALTGLGIGVAAGVVMGQGIVEGVLGAVSSDIVFVPPWGQIGLILLVAYGVALLTTIAPAYQASRIYPAEALRYE